MSVVSQKREHGGILFHIYNDYCIVDSTNLHFMRYLGQEAEELGDGFLKCLKWKNNGCRRV